MEDRRIRVLLIEDNPGDARLIRAFLATAGVQLFALETADRLSAGEARLAQGGIDLVLLDLSLPDSQGLETLLHIQTRDPQTPIVVLTGFNDNVLAVQALRSGAQDYLIKGQQVDSDLLVRTIRYAIERKRLEQQLVYNEQRFRKMIEKNRDVVALIDRAGRVLYESASIQRVLGYSADELIGRDMFELLHPDDLERAQVLFAQLLDRPGDHLAAEIRLRHQAGAWRWVEATGTNLLDDASVDAIVVNYHDITERKQIDEQLRHLNDDLERQVAERTRQLTEANARLTELDQLKDQFISRISHELRTPLANVKIYLELLDYGKPEKRSEYRQTLQREADRLHRLIEDLLSVTEFAKGIVEIDLAPLNLNELALRLVDEHRPLALERGLTLRCETRANLPRIRTDSYLIGQVMWHLLINALNYTPAQGRILVTTDLQSSDNDDWLVFAVQDSGPGIPSEDMPHIFKRFYRGAAARDYKIPGTGAGLAFSKEVVEKLGGRLDLETQLGRGSTFRVYLPLGPHQTSKT